MSALPSSVVTIGDGEITIAADLLAPKLGLSVEVLKAEMRRGYVYSVTEQGIGSDAGRTRLTFRYRARSWCVVVDPDGTKLITISSVDIADDAVQINVDADLPATGVIVSYAFNANAVAMMNPFVGTKQWGQLRDSDPFVGSSTNKPQPHFAVAFALPVP